MSKYLPKLRSSAPDAVLVETRGTGFDSARCDFCGEYIDPNYFMDPRHDSCGDDEEDPEVLLHYADQRRWAELQSQGLVPCDDFGDE